MRFADKFLDQKARIMVLVRGTLEEGGPYYAYLALKPSKLEEYEAAKKSGKVIELSDFGKVVEWGKGENPPEDVAKRMEEFGFNPNFEEEFLRELEAQRMNAEPIATDSDGGEN